MHSKLSDLYLESQRVMFVCILLKFSILFTFQVTKIRNIAAPKVNEESQSNPRMLKISLTDGKTTIHGVEVTKLDGINLNTLPGTKVKLAESIPISNGFLRLEPGALKVLG